MEDEIDLRQYIAILLKHWKLIVITTVLACAAALAVGLLTPQVFEAKSRVSILKGDAVLLLSLAKSSSIADGVALEAATSFKSTDLAAGKILAAVQARQQGNLIEFTAVHGDPLKAAFIANAWAEQYTAYVNNYFHLGDQTPQEARSYAESVKKIYVEKQKALLDFQSSSSIDDLKLLTELIQFQEKAGLLAGSARSEPAVKVLYYNFVTRALNSQNGALAMVVPEITAEGLDGKLSVTMTNVVTLPGQINPVTVPVDQMSDVTVSDVDNLISLVESRAGVSHAGTPGDVQSRISKLKDQIDAQTLQLTELSVQRDAALNAYQVALAKVSKAEIAQATSGGYVRVADKAVVPDAPLSDNKRWLNVIIALVVGLIAGVIGAFAVEYFSKNGGKSGK